MRIITSIVPMQRLAQSCKPRRVAIGFVPTMGYLHAGHLSLVRQARRRVGPRGLVVVSIFVNPTQFGPHDDLAKYPRDLARDKKLCRNAGVDVLFAPTDKQIYPGGDRSEYSTYVVEEKLSQHMEGAARPAHFRGVTTIVAKLFNLVLPDVAVFGAKDFQQAAVVKRMARDLNFPVKIILAPTQRESDGLALSSRNRYLSPKERTHATVLWQAIQQARATVRTSKSPVTAQRLKRQLTRMIGTCPAAHVDCIECFDPLTFEPVNRVRHGAHLALAVYIGKTRLIDNARL